MPMTPINSNINFGSAAFPRGYNPVSVIIAAMRDCAIHCFGGELFHFRNQNDQEIVCHAITCGNSELLNKLSSLYHNLNRMHSIPFVHYDQSVSLPNGKMAFTFELSNDCRSMRQIMDSPDHAQIGSTLFPKLVALLDEYYMISGRDSALCSLSLDTVFMDDRGRISLLPLQCQNLDYPRGFPLEVGTVEADERTDLYSAAMLTLQVVSGCEYESRTQHKRMLHEQVPDYLMMCLCAFPSCRPTLAQIKNEIAQEAAAAKAGQAGKSRSGRREPVPTDAAGNPIREPDAPKRKRSLFGRREESSQSAREMPRQPAREEVRQPAREMPREPLREEARQPAQEEHGAAAPDSISSLLSNIRHFWAVPDAQVSNTFDFPRPTVPHAPRQHTVIDDLGEGGYTRHNAGRQTYSSPDRPESVDTSPWNHGSPAPREPADTDRGDYGSSPSPENNRFDTAVIRERFNNIVLPEFDDAD